MKKPVVFFGSSAYSIPVLQTLLDNHVSIAAVITTPDKPAGRHLHLTPNPLKQFAQTQNLKVKEDFSQIPSSAIGLVAAYGKIIPQPILDKFNTQIYNIHPSILPKYRGPSPLQFQILDGLTKTGVTLIRLDAKMDHGPVVAREYDVITDSDTPETLGKRLFIKGTELFIKWLNDKMPNDQIQPQNEAEATYTRKLTRADGFIPYVEYQKQLKTNDQRLKTKFRAFFPWPGIWTTNPQGHRLKLTKI